MMNIRTSVLLIGLLVTIPACAQTKQSPDELLKNQSTRSAIMSAICNNPAMASEMINRMKNNSQVMQMMMQNSGLMQSMMMMANKDTVAGHNMTNMMMQQPALMQMMMSMMAQQPQMMKQMQGMMPGGKMGMMH